MMNINEYLETHHIEEDWGSGILRIRPAIECADGFTMSVQASDTHYCEPRFIDGPYSKVEVGFPSAEEDLLMPFAESPEAPTKTIYGWVPVEVVEQVIEKHGGMI